MKKYFFLMLILNSLSAVAASDSNIVKTNLTKSSASKSASVNRVYLLPFGYEVRSARDERGNLGTDSNASWAMGFSQFRHEIWFEKQNSKKSESMIGAVVIKNKLDEMALSYRYQVYRDQESLRISVGAGVLQRDGETISLIKNSGNESAAQDKTGAVREAFAVASMNGSFSVFYYDLALKSLFIKGSDPSPTLAAQARVGLSFRF